MKKICFLAFSLLLSSLVCHAQLTESYIKAVFSAGRDSMEGDDIAKADDVTFSTTGEWDGSSIALGARQRLTISAKTFQNICSIKLTAENEYDDYLKPENVTLTIVDAKGDGIESLQDLKCSSLSQKFASNQSCVFLFGSGVHISEITVETNILVCICEFEARLDITPEVPENSLRIYADDVVPFTRKTNYKTYRYYVSDDTENIVEDSSELADKYENVPNDGITLSGRPDGNYVVYVDTPSNFNTPLKHINVSYVATPATSIIDEPSFFENEEYFDLMGRRVEKCVRGLQIVRQGNKSKMVVR